MELRDEKWMYEDKEDVMDVELPVRKLCAMGTGEQVHILSYAAQDGKVDEFEHRVQALAFEMLDAVSHGCSRVPPQVW